MRKLDRNGISNLLVLSCHTSFKAIRIRKGLDARIFANGQRAGLQRMTTLCLFLTGGRGKCKTLFIHRKASCHASFASSSRKTFLAHILLLDVLGKVDPTASLWNKLENSGLLFRIGRTRTRRDVDKDVFEEDGL